MAREWAHYRYGVYDEGGIPDDPRHPSGYLTFQTDSSELIARANTCSDKQQPRGNWIRCDCLQFQNSPINGIFQIFRILMLRKREEECNSIGNSSCEFVASTYNPDIHSSLMYQPELDNVKCQSTVILYLSIGLNHNR